MLICGLTKTRTMAAGSSDAKTKVDRMYAPKEKNLERLERYVEKLKRNGELREHDA